FVSATIYRPLRPGDKEVDVIEGADPAEAHGAAFRGFRIDVVETLEVGGIFQLTEQRERVTPLVFLSPRDASESERANRGRNESSSAAAQKGPAGKLHELAPRSSHPPTPTP